MVIMIVTLAVQAVNTFMHINFTVRVDGLNRAIQGAYVTLCATLVTAFQPVKHSVVGGNGKRCTQRAQIAAKEAVDKHANDQQHCRIGDKRPCADELEGNDGFKGLNLDHLAGHFNRPEGQSKQAKKDHVFDSP